MLSIEELNEIFLEADTNSVLDLREIELTKDGIERIAAYISTSDSLMLLDMSGVRGLFESDSQQLTDAIENSNSLLFLNLNMCGLYNEKIKCLANAIKSHTSLLSLELIGNNFSFEGMQEIANTIKSNNSLLSINLLGNEIFSRSRQAISEALQSNNNLFSLNMTPFYDDRETKLKIHTKLRKNLKLLKAKIADEQIPNAIPAIPNEVSEYLKNLQLDCEIDMITNPVLYMWHKQERVKYDRSRVNTLPFYQEYTKENNFDNNLRTKNIENQEDLLPKGILSNKTDNIKIFTK